jgi:hypothetical protein
MDAGLLATEILVAVILVAVILVAGILAAGILAAGILAVEILAVGILAAGILATGILAAEIFGNGPAALSAAPAPFPCTQQPLLDLKFSLPDHLTYGHIKVSLTTRSGRKELRVAEQGYLAPLDHGAGSSCRSLYALALLYPPKVSSLSHTHTQVWAPPWRAAC